MIKKLLLLTLFAFIIVNISGCTFSMFNKDKRKAYLNSMKKDLNEIDRFFERMIINYDEDDPTRY